MFNEYAWGDTIPGSYEVIQKASTARQRPVARVASAVSAKGSSGRNKWGIKLCAFAAGTIVSFGILPGIPIVRSSGLLRTAISLGAIAIGAKVADKNEGYPGTWGWGFAFGGAMASAYEGWKVLDDVSTVGGSLFSGSNQMMMAPGTPAYNKISGDREQSWEIIKRWMGF